MPKGARNGVAYIVNGTYAIGPYVLGASFFDQQSAGSYVPGDRRSRPARWTEYGVATGANYVVGKDLSLFAQYMYASPASAGQRTRSATASHGNAQMQIIETGATYKW